ncbi:MAG: hypothetical protein ABL858_06755 [Candidatus Nitrotoga sp.]
MPTAFISHPDCMLYQMQSWHPESPARPIAIKNQLTVSSLMQHLVLFDALLVTREQLLRVHMEQHLALIEATAPTEGIMNLDMDTAMCPHSLNAAHRAAGAAVLAVNLVINKKMRNAFCSVRPPGHHAMRKRAMGFCLFNSIAAGMAHALEQHGLECIAIVDFDVHHDDELAGMNLLEADYAWVTEQIKRVADEYAEDRIVSSLEGGYDLPALGRSVAAHLQV